MGGNSAAQFERRLYLARKQFEREAEDSGYVCSLSASSLVYKAMCAGRLMSEFYPDLADPAYVTPFAIFHQRTHQRGALVGSGTTAAHPGA